MATPSYLRLRFHMDFRTRDGGPKWNRFVARGIQLPTWSFEAEEGDELIFYRALESTPAGNASARLFVRRTGPDASDRVTLEIAMRGRWKEKDERNPPLAAVEHMADEAEALLVLMGVRSPKARLVEVYQTTR